jgi:hypothetical protein
MSGRQLDFPRVAHPVAGPVLFAAHRSPIVATDLGDAALIAATR